MSEARATARAAHPGVPAGPAPSERLVRVLLVDDYARLRALYRAALEAEGPFEVVGEAGDGAEGVRLAVALRPDVILLDLSMPTLDGLEAMIELRRAMPEGRVVVLSGFNKERVEDLVLRLGAMAYVEKGATPQALARLVQDVAGRPPRPFVEPEPADVQRFRELI